MLILEGQWLTLRCALKKDEDKNQTVWVVNGNTIEPNYYEWRIKAEADMFEVFPTVLDDAGIFECLYEDQLRGFANITIVTRWAAIWMGYQNYMTVMCVFLPLWVALLGSNFFAPPPKFKKKHGKWGDAYIEHRLNDNVSKAKESIARKKFGDDLEKQKEFLLRSQYGPAETAAINRRIIQTILDGCR
ncbi:unnamed protein product, partial [Mesorhabditis spiculigera]